MLDKISSVATYNFSSRCVSACLFISYPPTAYTAPTDPTMKAAAILGVAVLATSTLAIPRSLPHRPTSNDSAEATQTPSTVEVYQALGLLSASHMASATTGDKRANHTALDLAIVKFCRQQSQRVQATEEAGVDVLTDVDPKLIATIRACEKFFDNNPDLKGQVQKEKPPMLESRGSDPPVGVGGWVNTAVSGSESVDTEAEEGDTAAESDNLVSLWDSSDANLEDRETGKPAVTDAEISDLDVQEPALPRRSEIIEGDGGDINETATDLPAPRYHNLDLVNAFRDFCSDCGVMFCRHPQPEFNKPPCPQFGVDSNFVCQEFYQHHSPLADNTPPVRAREVDAAAPEPTPDPVLSPREQPCRNAERMEKAFADFCHHKAVLECKPTMMNGTSIGQLNCEPFVDRAFRMCDQFFHERPHANAAAHPPRSELAYPERPRPHWSFNDVQHAHEPEIDPANPPPGLVEFYTKALVFAKSCREAGAKPPGSAAGKNFEFRSENAAKDDEELEPGRFLEQCEDFFHQYPFFWDITGLEAGKFYMMGAEEYFALDALDDTYNLHQDLDFVYTDVDMENGKGLWA